MWYHLVCEPMTAGCLKTLINHKLCDGCIIKNAALKGIFSSFWCVWLHTMPITIKIKMIFPFLLKEKNTKLTAGLNRH